MAVEYGQLKITRVSSRQNPKIQSLRRLGADAGFRRQAGVYLCDGVKLLADALRSGAPVRSVLAAEEIALPALPGGCEVLICPRDIANAVSPSRAPQGLVFTVDMPAPLPAPPERGRYLLLESLQDPGNVGSILRTAEAFSLSGVYLTSGCADPYGPKAVRAGMGAQFRLPVGFYEGAAPPAGKLPVYAAAAREKARPVEWLRGQDCIVMLGSEGGGLSGGFLSGADGLVAIPMPGGAESLGVAAAAAVVCYWMGRQG